MKESFDLFFNIFAILQFNKIERFKAKKNNDN